MKKKSLSHGELHELLEQLVDKYNRADFILLDPVSVPHQYHRKEDIEIAGFLTATIAWGNRKAILASAEKMMRTMGDSPFDFVMEAGAAMLEKGDAVIHRTFNRLDFSFFIRALRRACQQPGGLEQLFSDAFKVHGEAGLAIHEVRRFLLDVRHESRSEKHLADPLSGSSAKRLNMFLRWMVRADERGVDFGIWRQIPMAQLSVPLDVHSGNTARKFGLLTRIANDWKAVCELDASLRKFNPQDPVRYDYALFGLGVDPDLRGV